MDKSTDRYMKGARIFGSDVRKVLICILAWGICIFAIDVLIETLERSGVFICNEAGCGRLGGRWGFALK